MFKLFLNALFFQTIWSQHEYKEYTWQLCIIIENKIKTRLFFVFMMDNFKQWDTDFLTFQTVHSSS